MAFPNPGMRAVQMARQGAAGVYSASRRSRGSDPRSGGCCGCIVPVLVLLVLIGGGFAAWKFYLDPTLCNSSPLFDRHGQPGNVPLPGSCHFSAVRPLSDNGQNLGDVWFWTVESPNDPATLKTFYATHLPGDGWTQKSVGTHATNGATIMAYCQ